MSVADRRLTLAVADKLEYLDPSFEWRVYIFKGQNVVRSEWPRKGVVMSVSNKLTVSVLRMG